MKLWTIAASLVPLLAVAGCHGHGCCSGVSACAVDAPPAAAEPLPAGEAPPDPPAGEVVYTCPMHPGVNAQAPGSCPICAMPLERR